jgi:nitric oxide reductase NorD protein
MSEQPQTGVIPLRGSAAGGTQTVETEAGRVPDLTAPRPGGRGTPLDDDTPPAPALDAPDPDDPDAVSFPQADRSPEAESAAAGSGGAGIAYPEWDHVAGCYRRDGVLVRELRPAEGDAAWGARVLREHAVLVRRIRQRFERLRARRMRLGQQREGDELDLAACVRALVERRAGIAADDRLYLAVRPARRAIAIALLVDVSGSTDTFVSSALQVIDVEKIAVLLASEALDALGDDYAVLAFAGNGASDVRLTMLKDFAERNGDAVRRRVSALAPHGFTRLGAAVRHATALLARQPAGHRLLLILSDGRPNDADHYQAAYAVEDSRQAMHEARAQDVFPFCLTVDREGAAYLPRIFGPTGHTILRHPDQLPMALLGVVRQLLAS